MDIRTHMLNDTARLTAFVADPEVGYRLFRKRPGIPSAPDIATRTTLADIGMSRKQ